MDLAVYISELLNEQGTVIIPGLGIFKRVRAASYYNETEGRFYPPQYHIEFTHQPDTADHSLAQYISTKNNVSPASARFFINKWVADVVQQAATSRVSIGQLGALYRQNNELQFKPDAATLTPSAVYGFSPVSLRQQSEAQVRTASVSIKLPLPPAEPPATTVSTAPEPVQPAPQVQEPTLPLQPTVAAQPEVTAQPAVATKPVTAIPPQLEAETTPAPVVETQAATAAPVAEIIEEEIENSQPARSNRSRWVIAAVIVLVFIGAGFAIYQTQLNQKSSATESIAATPAAPEHKPVADTVIINKQPALTDTSAAITPQVTDSAKQQQAQVIQPNATAQTGALMVNDKNYKYTLLGGACSTMAEATIIINRYKAQGVTAGVLKNPPGDRYFKISFGFFETFTEGQQAKLKLVATKHLERSKLYVETIRQNPKK